jgi:hypothetical protein
MYQVEDIKQLVHEQIQHLVEVVEMVIGAVHTNHTINPQMHVYPVEHDILVRLEDVLDQL